MSAAAAASQGRLIVISGPSGSGKTTLCAALIARTRCERVITATTRAPRGTERAGVDYHFLTREAFERGVAAGDFLEHASVFGHLYGTPRAGVERGIAEGKSLLLAIDVQGAELLRAAAIDRMTSVFVVPPDLATLEARLRRRGTDTAGAIDRRLDEARREIDQKRHYDIVIVNDDLERAIELAIRELRLERR